MRYLKNSSGYSHIFEVAYLNGMCAKFPQSNIQPTKNNVNVVLLLLTNQSFFQVDGGHFKFLALTMTSIDVDCMCTGLEMLENIGVCIAILKTSQYLYTGIISGFSR